MNSKIQLHISPDSLAADQEGFFMRADSLSSLKKLSRNGVHLTAGPNRFTNDISRLLKQENIPFEEPSASDPLPSWQIHTKTDGTLLLSSLDSDPVHEYSFSNWTELTRHILLEQRTATHKRKTAETDISISINLDGTGISEINTGIPFFDHMLEQISRHGYMDLTIRCDGDLQIDEHHTIEDTAITLGESIAKALGNKRGIGRYGFMVAMDETRSLVALDLSGRPWCEFEGRFNREKVGAFPTEMTSHFFTTFAMSLKATLHVAVKGENDHHQIEACFKGLARALRQAVDRNENYLDILPSSKGLL